MEDKRERQEFAVDLKQLSEYDKTTSKLGVRCSDYRAGLLQQTHTLRDEETQMRNLHGGGRRTENAHACPSKWQLNNGGRCPADWVRDP